MPLCDVWPTFRGGNEMHERRNQCVPPVNKVFQSAIALCCQLKLMKFFHFLLQKTPVRGSPEELNP
jgi:hypothetical protein